MGRMAFPRFRGHPDWREYALGETHGKTEAKEVHGRVQGGRGEALQRRAGGRSAQVAADLDLTETALREWVKRAATDAGKGPPDALTTAERDELSELRKRVKRLEMEREILKKAAAFFAKENA